MGNKHPKESRGTTHSVPLKPPHEQRNNKSKGATKQTSSSPSSKASPTSSSGRASDVSTASTADLLANWKLFNELENREEADVLELSLFLDALTQYMPGIEGGTRGKSLSQDHSDESSDLQKGPTSPPANGSLPSPPPTAAPSLGKNMSEQVMGSIDIANMYLQCPELDDVITLRNVEELIESCKNGLKIPRNVVIRVVNETMNILRQEPTVMPVTIAPANHVTVIGDLHGQLDDLLLILRENGLPSDSNPYVFNGDFVDRGDRGVEVAVIIYLFKILYPCSVWINRGNHEESSITQVFGFMKECETKYDRFIFELFCESFKWLPLATLLDQRVLVLHGGVPREFVYLKDINGLDRTEYDLTRWRERPRFKNEREPHRRMQLMRDILWSDPKKTRGWEENKRGAGVLYGPDVVHKFMSKNKLALIIRSHECVPSGFDWPYQDKGMLVTLFSASNYCGKANNLGCFVRIPSNREAKPAFFQYMASAESRDLAVSNLDGLFSLIVEHNDELLEEFIAKDTAGTGHVSIAVWGGVMEEVLDLSLDWRALQPLLTSLQDGSVPYKGFLERYNATGGLMDAASSTSGEKSATDTEEELDPARAKRRHAFNSLYRHRARLEALFRVLDRDGNGIITLEELENGIKLLNEHLPAGMKTFSTNAMDFMRMLDFSHDNELNVNEFMEGFRINAKMTVHAKWKRARKKIKALSAIGALRVLANRDQMEQEEEEEAEEETSQQEGEVFAGEEGDAKAEEDAEVNQLHTRIPSGRFSPTLTRHGSIQRIGLAAELEDVELHLGDDLVDTIEESQSEDDDEEVDQLDEDKPVAAPASTTEAVEATRATDTLDSQTPVKGSS